MVQKTICASPTTSRTWRASTNQPRRSRPQESITAATPEAFRFQRLIPVTAKRRTPPADEVLPAGQRWRTVANGTLAYLHL